MYIMYSSFSVIGVSDVEHLTGAQEKLLILSQILESFVITTYPTETCTEDQEVHLLKLAHNFFPAINTSLYSLEVRIAVGWGPVSCVCSTRLIFQASRAYHDNDNFDT